jgi:heptosyltransferase-2
LMVDKVFTLDDKRDAKLLFIKAAAVLPRLLLEKYDIVLDLQRNAASRTVRRVLQPKSYSEFDRFSLQSAGARVQQTIDALQLTRITNELPEVELKFNQIIGGEWSSMGYNNNVRYIVLNPAGSSVTKNWPIEYYERFAVLWNTTVDDQTKFLILGTDRIVAKAEYLKQQLGSKIINLVNATSATEALILLQKAQFVLTEDSGLMHMAWISRIPLVALFGSTPSVWSKPLGDSSICLDSSDLECGNCNKEVCKFGDVHCLTRHSPEFVLEKAQKLLQQKRSILA